VRAQEVGITLNIKVSTALTSTALHGRSVTIQAMRKVRNVTRENLFERWLADVVRAAGPYDDYELFSDFVARTTVSDTVTGDAEVLPASEKRDVNSDG